MSNKSWACAEFCTIEDSAILDRYHRLLKVLCECNSVKYIPRLFELHLCECTKLHRNTKAGHSHSCYIQPDSCESLALAINFLSPHFPRVRSIDKLLHRMSYNYRKMKCLDHELEVGNVLALKEMITNVEEAANKGSLLKRTRINLDENYIVSTHPLAFKLLTKRSIDIPRLACISCERLYCRKGLIDVNKMRTPMFGVHWQILLDYLVQKGIEIDYMCYYCAGHFRRNTLPPLCILNDLYVEEIPDVFTTLNDYEKILIQRAKAFQCVQRMGTVANKKVPRRQMMQKVKGSVFHLPLPLEQTFDKICPPNVPINPNHEVYIVVRGIPTKSKIVWENLVNVKKIYEVLLWLKRNNPFYSKIILPSCHNELLNDELKEVEFSVEDANDKDISTDKDVALLTRVRDPGSYYDHYTIYPMYEKRRNDTPADLYQMLKVEGVPLDVRRKNLDVLCFPDLYPYGRNGINQDRKTRIRDFDFGKSRLLSKHSRFRLNIQYIFFLLNYANMRQIGSGIYHSLTVTNPREKYTAGQLLNSTDKSDLEKNLNTIFGKLRNTRQYWRRVRCNVNAMTRDYGPATWFLTLSPAEWLWADLGEYIKEVSPTLRPIESVSELVAADPVSAARFVEIKFQAILDFICSSDNPIGRVKHYFIRREYQNRGMPHWHMLIWIHDAPVIGESSNDDIIDFILKHVTCAIPDKKVSPQLYGRVVNHQQHRHNSYCLRNKKTKRGFIRKCRFGFPRPIVDNVALRDVVVTIANRRQMKSKSRLYDLPRAEHEKSINDYNPVILTAWEGNMDIQFIGEKSTLLNWYCTKYTTKSECGYGVDTFEIINSTMSLRSSLWNIALRSLNHRECGAIEAADTLIGIPLYKTDPDTTFRWLDVNEVRHRRVKPRQEIENLDPESTDIFCHSFIDNYYPNRPHELESCNLYDFAKWYDVSRTKASKCSLEFQDANTRLYLKKRDRGHVIVHFTHNKNCNPEKYYYSLLLLFKPWRNLSELKDCYDTYTEAFASMQCEKIISGLRYHQRIEELQKALDYAKELINEHLAKTEGDDEKLSSPDQLECRPIEAEGAVQELREMRRKTEDSSVAEMIANLNADQERIFRKVTEAILSDSNDIVDNNNNPSVLRLFVSGEGGTGKSFLIKTIRCWVKEIIGKDTAVLAPTGIAAFNIDGLTVHRLFQLPVEHGRTPKYRPLSDIVLKTLRSELKSTILLIIDEVSMVSNVTLLYIHLRLTEIFDTVEINDGWFGKKHILLFGDLLQLPPVRAEPAFVKISNTKSNTILGSLAASNLWMDLFACDELGINMRQKEDDVYRGILSRIRLGIVTKTDLEILESRKIRFESSLDVDARLDQLCNYIRTLPSDAICLLPTRRLCDVLNAAMLKTIDGEEIRLLSRDVLDCPELLKKRVQKLLDQYEDDNSQTAGLSKLIIVKIGAKVMLRRNIDITLGLVNGAIAEIVGFSRGLDNNKDVETIQLRLSTGVVYTLERCTSKFQLMDKAYVDRHQFPISLCYGITVHKCQGLSLKTVVVDVGNTVFSCGQTYVALSRVTSLEGLHIINLDPAAVQANKLAVLEYGRLRSIYRPDLAAIIWRPQKRRRVTDFQWAWLPKVVNCLDEASEKNNPTGMVQSIKGFVNTDHVSAYANVVMQCMLHCRHVRQELLGQHNCDAVRALAEAYYTKENVLALNSFGIRKFLGGSFVEDVPQDASEFLLHLIDSIEKIRSNFVHELTHKVYCKACYRIDVSTEENIILALPLSESRQRSRDLQGNLKTYSAWCPLDDSICTAWGKEEMIIKTDVTMT